MLLAARTSGLEEHLEGPVALGLEDLIAVGRLVQRQSVSGEPFTPRGSESSRSSGMMSPTQAFTFAWPMRSWICLSNSVSMGMGSIIPPYTPMMEMVPPRRTSSMARCRALSRLQGRAVRFPSMSR